MERVDQRHLEARRAPCPDDRLLVHREQLDGPVMRLGGPDVPAMPFAKPLEDAFMPTPQKIAAAMRRLAAY